MLHVGQQSAFPKLKFLGNRMGIERAIERGRRACRRGWEDSDDEFVGGVGGRSTTETETEGMTEDEEEREEREKEGLLKDLRTVEEKGGELS